MAKPIPLPGVCNILLIGGGGREHALAWKLNQSRHLGTLWSTDRANAGLAQLCKQVPEDFKLSNQFKTDRWCERNDIHLIVVGPEAELADGVADALQTSDRLVFGPKKAGAQIEADKAWAKELIRAVSVPTADSRTFRNVEQARAYAESREEGMVVKASGLAAGKGVIVCETPAEALETIDHIMVNETFGSAGKTIIIEEKLEGQEVSVLALTDGKTLWMLDPCQDHKQLNEGDTGPNTGGMGAYCPTPIVDDALLSMVERDILVPTIDGLKREGIDYRGVLYAGLMLTHGGPKVLEFNCRFGDPECQPLMMRLKSDLIEVLWATSSGALRDLEIEFDERTACTVVMASAGYPGAYEKGKVISGVEEVETDAEDVMVFHAGTKRDKDGNLITNGGRVLAVTALADDLQAAQAKANAACEQIHFEGAQYRSDIGGRVLNAKVR